MATITIAEVDGVSKYITVTGIADALTADTTANLPTNLTTTMVKLTGTIIREDAHFNGSVYEEHSGTRAVELIIPASRIRSIRDITT